MASEGFKRITKRVVDEARPGTGDVFIRDSDLKGFALRVKPSGVKSYVLDYRMPGGRGAAKGRYTIGKHSSPWTPDSARKAAQSILEGIHKGINPVQAKREAHRLALDLAFSKYVPEFIDRYAKREQPRSWQQADKMFAHDVLPVWRDKPLPQITRKDVASLLSRMADEKPATARYAHAMLRKLFRWAVGRGDLDVSPMTDMPPPAPALSRDRVLSNGELATLWQVSTLEPGRLGIPTITGLFGHALRLLIVTGARRDEVLSMDFAELDWVRAIWTIPAERAKNGKAHIVPLNTLAMTELEALGAATRKRGLVFTTTGTTPISGISKMKTRLDAAMLAALQADDASATLAPFRMHDIRRTVATGLQKLGVRFEVTEAVLNHVSGAKSGVAGVYQRHDWAGEKRDALDAWGRHVAALVNGTGDQSNIVPMRRA